MSMLSEQDTKYFRGLSRIIIIAAIGTALSLIGGGIYAYRMVKSGQGITSTYSSLPETNLNLKSTKLATLPDNFAITNPIIFSPDGYKAAYGVKDYSDSRPKASLYINNELVKSADSIGLFTFSPNGEHFAYSVYDGARNSYIILDSKQLKKYRDTGSLSFSWDGGKLIYTAGDDKGDYVVLNEKEIKKYNTGIETHNEKLFVSTPVISLDGSQMAWSVGEGIGSPNREFIVVNNNKGAIHHNIYSLTFSADSKHLVYVAEDNGECIVILDNKQISRTYVNNPLTCGTIKPIPGINGELVFIISNEERNNLLLNGEEIQTDYPPLNMPDPVFSADGQKLIYFSLVEGSNKMIIRNLGDGSEEVIDIPDNHKIVPQLIASPDSKSIAYISHLASNKEVVIVDGEEYGIYDKVYHINFTFDGSKIVYGVKDSDELWWIVEPVE